MGMCRQPACGPRRARRAWRAPWLSLALAAGLLATSAASTVAAGLVEAPTASETSEGRLAELDWLGRAQPEVAAERLQTWLATLPDDAADRPAALELLGWWKADINDPDGNERAAAQLELLAQRRPQWRARCEAGAALVRAKMAAGHGTTARAERLLTEAISRLPETLPPLQRLRYLLLAGDVRSRATKFDDAVRWYLQALAIADTHGPLWRRSEIRSTLAYVLYQVGQKDRAATLARESLDLARQAGDDFALSQAYTTRSILLSNAGQDAEELAALRGAIEHARRAGAKRDEILGLGNIADYYLQRGQYAVALETSERAVALAREVRSVSSESLALTNAGLALISMHRKAEGLKQVQAALAIEERTGSLASMSDTYRELGTYLERAGDLKEAFDAFREHRRLADEAFKQEQQQAILELQESYDNQRRQRELELLNRQNRLKEEQLLQRELQQRLWALAAALGVTSVSVIVLLLQRARRANRALADTNELLKVQSERDPLTGLANRRHLQQAMRRQGADRRAEGTFYLLDVDHFKQINDTHGHAVGDQVLMEAARRLRATLREQDLIVRWGGEEFLVVVQSLSPDKVEALAQRLLQAFAGESVIAGERRVPVTASIGFATFPLGPAGIALGWEQAIEVVDTAMYLAKAHGRNRAYGIRLMQAATADEAMDMSRTLEEGWRSGRVTLTLLQGPTAAERSAA